jgi:ArsR family transcriptional regulator, arsenate/arsenite/antimonite-responsive transcriptional repressor
METKMAVRQLELASVECCPPVATPGISEDQAATLATVFKALGDPSRVRIVNLLANAPEAVCVCDLMPLVGLSQGTVSFHLKKLLDVGLLDRERRGTWAYYSLNRDGLGRLADVFVTEEGAR